MALTKKTTAQLSVIQEATEKAMLGITLRDKIRNGDTPYRTKMTDVISCIARFKWQWVGLVARENAQNWTKRITN